MTIIGQRLKIKVKLNQNAVKICSNEKNRFFCVLVLGYE